MYFRNACTGIGAAAVAISPLLICFPISGWAQIE